MLYCAKVEITARGCLHFSCYFHYTCLGVEASQLAFGFLTKRIDLGFAVHLVCSRGEGGSRASCPLLKSLLVESFQWVFSLPSFPTLPLTTLPTPVRLLSLSAEKRLSLLLNAMGIFSVLTLTSQRYLVPLSNPSIKFTLSP